MHLLLATAVIVLMQSQQPAAPPPLPPCDSRPEAKQFDFWIGEWTVLVNGKPAGTNRIEKILNGCVIQENWTGANGTEGKSWNWFDIGDGKWHQLWLSANGAPQLRLSGTYGDDAMRYEGTSTGPGGVTIQNRLQFFRLQDGGVRQLWQQSRDEGRTWATVFDGEYRRKQKPDR